MMGDNNLYKKHINRYLNNRRLKPVTVCIAVLASVGTDFPQIIFCADRLVTSGIQFEGGESKIKKITDYCFVMQSSNDSLTSDLILEKVKEKMATSTKPIKIRDIVEILRNECINHKREHIERTVLAKYNLVFESVGITPESIVHKAVNEVGKYQYPFECDFIVFGLELSGEAHIFQVNQDAEYRLQDSQGFCTIGSGGWLAYLEMTKHGYARNFPAIVAIPRVYIAKRISERAEGVGRNTDLAVLYFTGGVKEAEFKPAVFGLSHPDFLKKLDEAYEAIKANEKAELEKISKVVLDMLTPKEEPPKS